MSVLAGDTKESIGCFFFSLTTLLPIQDMSGVAWTYLGATHTHFGSCYACFGLVTDYVVLGL